MSEKVRPPITAYFYPHDHTDEKRLQAARAVGRNHIPSDMALLRQATPLFSGHEHPTYTIGNGLTEWEDTDSSVVAIQSELARNFELDAWIVLGYAGFIKGQLHKELVRPLDEIAKRNDTLKFALMTCLGLPRVHLPIDPTVENSRGKERHFDLNFKTFTAMVDHAAQYWDNPRYLELGGRPLLSIYGLRPSNIAEITHSEPDLVERLLKYCEEKYRVIPHLTANAFDPEGATALWAMGFKHITTYSFLPDFNKVNHEPGAASVNFEDLQCYETQLARRKNDWKRIREAGVHGFVPNATVSWDASGRGVGGKTLEEVSGKFPWTPIITNPTAEKFSKALNEVWTFLQLLPIEHRIITILAWNEIGDGAALLPKLRGDNSIDYSNLLALKQFAQSFQIGQ